MVWIHSKITKDPNQLSTQIDGNTVLFGVTAGKYFELDAIASDIWMRIDEHPVLGDLCESLARDYESDAATILSDIRPLIATLAEHKLLSIVSNDPE